MTNLTQASHELFSRPADEKFETLADLATYCHNQQEHSRSSKNHRLCFRRKSRTAD